MKDGRYNVLFLCTGNSARSIMAEAILNRLGRGRFQAFSAGSFPKSSVNPTALQLLESLSYPTEGLRSKSWDEFAGDGAPEMYFVFTVCDNAADEVCPVWPGRPVFAHWGIFDPAAVEGTEAEIRGAFSRAYDMLYERISLFVNLPISSLDRLTLKRHLEDIARAEPSAKAI